MPVIGFLHSATPGSYAPMMAAFRKSLNDAGYFEGQNVTIEYRWAEYQYDRLPELAADLVRRQVAVMFAGSFPAVLPQFRSSSQRAVTRSKMVSSPVSTGQAGILQE
jgi:putative ABC transport system substrate-binding protein